MFLLQAVAPILLVILSWQAVLVIAVAANLLWALVARYRFVSVSAAYWGFFIAKLKWVTGPAATAYLFTRGETTKAVWALLWMLPIVAPMVGAFLPPGQTGRIQTMFMRRLGYQSMPPAP